MTNRTKRLSRQFGHCVVARAGTDELIAPKEESPVLPIEICQLHSRLQEIIEVIEDIEDEDVERSDSEDIEETRCSMVILNVLNAAHRAFVDAVRRRIDDPNCPPADVIGNPDHLTYYGIDTMHTLLARLPEHPG